MTTLSRRRAPQQLGGAIQELLSRLDSQGNFEIVRLIRVWPEVVGEAIARRTEVSGLKFHTAVVRVSGAMWIQELNLMKPQILARLRDALGNDAVRDLRFVQGRMSRRERPRLRRWRVVAMRSTCPTLRSGIAARVREPDRSVGPFLALASAGTAS